MTRPSLCRNLLSICYAICGMFLALMRDVCMTSCEEIPALDRRR